MPRTLWAKAARFSSSFSSTNPLPSKSAFRMPRPLLQVLNQQPTLRVALRSSSLLMRPSILSSNLFSQFLNSSRVMSVALLWRRNCLMAMAASLCAHELVAEDERADSSNVEESYLCFSKTRFLSSWSFCAIRIRAYPGEGTSPLPTQVS